ncbi:MAG: hypothetical protein BWK73_06410 [Thiothrix lacustris]|uniref:Cytochrome c-552/DMSO reductase-like haem-binding domain-containing protein n=1 Tax=Thiothrix lacustris TaxID=525917 RepID=A0A1Y1QXM6_9GAMM|nr:MAG: hypothetical protein BWK73_06410 [Thiothrix lacustris]
MKHPLLMASALILCSALSLAHAEIQTIKINTLKAAPQLDGSAEDWQDIAASTIKLTYVGKPELTKTVLLKAGVFGDEVFFHTEWEDSTKDIQHKPSLWDEAQQKYVEGPQLEDRFAIEFAIKGDYDANWFSGKEFTSDMWNWKAARTNPIGISHDKITVISRQPMAESYKATLPDGSHLYINRPTDKGVEPYQTKRYFKKQQDIMPKYVPQEKLPAGAADIKAKGVWKDGHWSLEQRRKLDTGHEDDVTFTLGNAVKGAVAVFDHDDSAHHFISETLTFVF